MVFLASTPPASAPSRVALVYCLIFFQNAERTNSFGFKGFQEKYDGNPLIDVATAYRRVLDGEAFPAAIQDTVSQAGGCVSIDPARWLAEMLEAFGAEPFRDNPDRCRALAWTNRRVADLNRLIRRVVVGADDEERFVVGEMVTAGTPITKRVQITIDGERHWVDSVALPTDTAATGAMTESG